MISYERLVEIVIEAERARCSQLHERYDGECRHIKGDCKDCIIRSLDINEEECNELFKEFI